jgi:hypothetical protein
MEYCTVVIYQKETLEPLFVLVALSFQELAEEINHLLVVSEHEIGFYGFDTTEYGAAALYKVKQEERA